MNRIVQTVLPVVEMTQTLRTQLIDTISDSDLAFRLHAATPTLGELCRRNGEIQMAYIDSLKTFSQHFDFRAPDATIGTDRAKLRSWYVDLDRELRTVIESLSEDTVNSRQVTRGSDYAMPLDIHVHVYREALLIFLAQADLYLRAIGKIPSERWESWLRT